MAESGLVARRRVSWKSFLGTHIALGLLAVVIWAAGWFSGLAVHPVLVGAAGLLPILAAVLCQWLVTISTEYRVFDDSLEVESGIVSRTIENIQLFRVRDLGLHQSILDRLLNVGTVSVSSTDHSAPHLPLKGVDDPRELYETLRELVAKSQATRRTMIVEDDMEHHPGGGAE